VIKQYIDFRMKITIALGQIKSVYCNVNENVSRHVNWINKAKSKGARLIVFPELSLTGYYLREAVREVAMSADHPALQKITNASRGISVVAGFVEKGSKNRYYNSAWICENGKKIGIHRKMYLPTYGLFEEARYFTSGKVLNAFPVSWGKLGTIICEDAWYPDTVAAYADKKINALVITAASPTRGLTVQEGHVRENVHRALHKFYAKNLKIPVIFVNTVDFEHGLFFWGGSALYSPDGNLVCHASLYDEELLIIEMECDGARNNGAGTGTMKKGSMKSGFIEN
jgi:predicted amidohydrolase